MARLGNYYYVVVVNHRYMGWIGMVRELGIRRRSLTTVQSYIHGLAQRMCQYVLIELDAFIVRDSTK